MKQQELEWKDEQILRSFTKVHIKRHHVVNTYAFDQDFLIWSRLTRRQENVQRGKHARDKQTNYGEKVTKCK